MHVQNVQSGILEMMISKLFLRLPRSFAEDDILCTVGIPNTECAEVKCGGNIRVAHDRIRFEF